jgi:hypothetical protein
LQHARWTLPSFETVFSLRYLSHTPCIVFIMCDEVDWSCALIQYALVFPKLTILFQICNSNPQQVFQFSIYQTNRPSVFLSASLSSTVFAAPIVSMFVIYHFYPCFIYPITIYNTDLLSRDSSLGIWSSRIKVLPKEVDRHQLITVFNYPLVN